MDCIYSMSYFELKACILWNMLCQFGIMIIEGQEGSLLLASFAQLEEVEEEAELSELAEQVAVVASMVESEELA